MTLHLSQCSGSHGKIKPSKRSLPTCSTSSAECLMLVQRIKGNLAPLVPPATSQPLNIVHNTLKSRVNDLDQRKGTVSTKKGHYQIASKTKKRPSQVEDHGDLSNITTTANKKHQYLTLLSPPNTIPNATTPRSCELGGHDEDQWDSEFEKDEDSGTDTSNEECLLDPKSTLPSPIRDATQKNPSFTKDAINGQPIHPSEEVENFIDQAFRVGTEKRKEKEIRVKWLLERVAQHKEREASSPNQLAKANDLKLQRLNGPRSKTSDGFPVYTLEELNIREGRGGKTPLCPFDCWCCF